MTGAAAGSHASSCTSDQARNGRMQAGGFEAIMKFVFSPRCLAVPSGPLATQEKTFSRKHVVSPA